MKNRISDLINRAKEKLGPYRKTIIEPLLKILAIIAVCAIIAHMLQGGETLSEYAAKNPEIAYQTSK